MQKQKLGVRFFRTLENREPVRDWLKGLPNDERKTIGDDLRTLQFGWPVGMRLVRKLDSDLWELRIDLPNRIARVLFTIIQDEAILLHGFVKKTQKMPLVDLNTAKRRKSLL